MTEEQRVHATWAIEDLQHTFVVSDPHFDHANIIKYCDRPFSSTEQMNRTILRNWKETIKPDDLVFFLGDMCHGQGHRDARWWLDQLPGRIVYVKGSHDQGIRPTSDLETLNCIAVVDYAFVEVPNRRLMFIHNPWDPEVGLWQTNGDEPFAQWLVHGHVHKAHPYLDIEHRWVNVSMDMTGFYPVRFDHLLRSIERKERYYASLQREGEGEGR